MDSVPLQRIKRIYLQALNLSPESRAQFLDTECRDEPELRAEVDLLLDSTPSADFLISDSMSLPLTDPEFERIGRYKILGKIASGGMGTVWEAEQDEPRRRVAIKVLHWFAREERDLARFQREAAVLAYLDHPNIARVVEAGTESFAGTPVAYIVMELVEEPLSIVEHAKRNELDRAQRIEIFLTVCAAIQHGHRRGIIHRDIKPDNILVDSQNVPRVIDFGIAQCTGSDFEIATVHTEKGQLLGTLRYMSPEQLTGIEGAVDSRTDVYSLGLVLYELLTDSFPYELGEARFFDTPRIIREVAATPLSRHDPTLGGDLEAILDRTLAKDPEHRYGSVLELQMEIERHLAGEPVLVRRHHNGYILQRTIAKYRVSIAAVSVLLIALIATALTFANLYSKEQIASEASDRNAYYNSIALAYDAFENLDTRRMRELLEQCPRERRGWEWNYLYRRSDDSTGVLRSHDGTVACVAASGDGRWIVTGGDDDRVRVWDAETATLVRTHNGHANHVVVVDFAPQGARFVSGGHDGQLMVWDCESASSVVTIQTGHKVFTAALLSDGRIVAAGEHPFIGIWSSDGECEQLVANTFGVFRLDVSADERYLAAGGDDRVLWVWDLIEKKLVQTIDQVPGWSFFGRPTRSHHSRIVGVRFAHGSQLVATAEGDHFGKVWNRSTGRILYAERYPLPIGQIDISPLSRHVALTLGAVVQPRRFDQHHPEHPLRGHDRAVTDVKFMGETHLVSSSVDGTARIWDLNRRRGVSIFREHESEVLDVGFSPTGTWLATAGRDQKIVLWQWQGRRPKKALEWVAHPKGRITKIAWAPDGQRLASIASDGVLRIWSVPDGREVSVIQLERGGLGLDWRGEFIASLTDQGRIDIWSSETLECIRSVDPPDNQVRSIALDPRGERMAVGRSDGSIEIHSTRTGEALRTGPGEFGSVNRLAYSPDGRNLAIGTTSGNVAIWNLEEPAPVIFASLDRNVEDLAFSPDGLRLLTTDFTPIARLWAVETRQPLIRLVGHRAQVRAAEFSHDGNTIVSGSGDSRVRVWDGTPMN